MNKKLLSTILGVIIIIASFLFSNNKAEDKIEKKSVSNNQAVNINFKSTKSQSKNNTSYEETDYDTDMSYDKIGMNKNASVDYYMLVLSWSPGFCEYKKQSTGYIPKRLKFQCDDSNKFGWVIHGLWPQSQSARYAEDHPRFCKGDLPPVAEKILNQFMKESPGKSLLQGQWEKHGACAFSDPKDYFMMQKALFKNLSLPTSKLNKKEFFKWMRNHNSHLNGAYMKYYNNELKICYNKKWKAIDCPR